MGWYSYFRERLTWGSNPYAAISDCKDIVMELVGNPRIPFTVAAPAIVDFMAILADHAGNGYTVTATYENAMEAAIELFRQMRDTTAATDRAWMLDAQEEGGGPPYIPSDYEVRPEDIDPFEEEYDPDKEERVSTLDAIQEALCADCEFGTGVRRPWPDWEHIASWTQTDWIKMQTFKSKMLAAARHDFFTMGPAIDALAAAKAAMPHVSLPRQVELAMWATEIVDGLISGLEGGLQEMCAGSLHSHQGRRIQKEMPQ